MPSSSEPSCALRSPSLSSGSRVADSMPSKRDLLSFPFLYSLDGGINIPSSCIDVDSGIEPGVRPPMSAWWAREATKNSSPPSANTGAMQVTSGRCVPPLKGSLSMKTSPSDIPGSPIIAFTAKLMEPRCTGMCAACAIISPEALNIAQDRSLRSFILGENPARMRTTPISSAIELSAF